MYTRQIEECFDRELQEEQEWTRMEVRMIEIMNMRNIRPSKPYDFRVDRSSPVGNPMRLKNEDARDAVCDYYEDVFIHNILGRRSAQEYLNDMKRAYEKYGKLRLFCWCAPKRCHAETIKSYIEEIS